MNLLNIVINNPDYSVLTIACDLSGAGNSSLSLKTAKNWLKENSRHSKKTEASLTLYKKGRKGRKNKTKKQKDRIMSCHQHQLHSSIQCRAVIKRLKMPQGEVCFHHNGLLNGRSLTIKRVITS